MLLKGEISVIRKKLVSALMAGVFGGSLMFGGLAMAAGNGDADGDGSVDIFDAVAVLNYATGKNRNGVKDYNNADVNGDGFVDKADAEGIQNIIRTGRIFNQYSKTATQKTTAYGNYQLTDKKGNEWVDVGDNVTVLQEFENAYFVRYPISNGKTKERWVAKSIFEESNTGGGAISPSGYAYPLGHKTNFGNGHDHAIAEGTPVYAIADGEAKFYQVMGTYKGRYATVSYGNLIELSCNNGALAKYAHLSRFERRELAI